ncbi:hypothetical protein [Actinoplanes regularis]|uniref:Uncharacterized protein n=1 Tax=Actinoplanes regularis TaxID=52697 RepID=A0A239FDZ9_9ACTN|nr:hypothetical protein [Actinoplanes regularis]GIE89557.1 hypothetical protein Are01nite_60370 [Actinoplanes regularis]SNS55156.1 hypothetical protein SAMN06264365_11838 [Actinoplanes regularis]
MPVTVYDVARALPDLPALRRRCQALATLDAIVSPDWEYRYYSFDTRWAPDEQMASMRNGSGDAWSIVFSRAGAFIRGFDHESPMARCAGPGDLWPGLVDTVPQVFSGCVNEPAFSFKGTLEATVCLWRQHDDDRWHAGDVDFPDRDDPDGADRLFHVLMEGTPLAYQQFAEDYYETTMDLATIGEIFALRPLTDELVRRLNPDLLVADLTEDLAEIGYPPRPE